MRPAAGDRGYVLMEVCMAVLLLTVCLLPLIDVTVSLAGRTPSLDARAAQLTRDTGAAEGAGSGEWTWGPRPGRLVWSPGPLLLTELIGPGTKNAELVGVWADGWFRGEWRTDGAESLTLGSAAEWQLCTGSEVVVRARREDGAWGAPFRTIVPGNGNSGGEVDLGALEPGAPSSGMAVHLPSAAMAGLSLACAGARDVSVTACTPQTWECPAGRLPRAACNGVVQTWRGAARRSLDVYF
jgi:hypothetical protein